MCLPLCTLLNQDTKDTDNFTARSSSFYSSGNSLYISTVNFSVLNTHSWHYFMFEIKIGDAWISFKFEYNFQILKLDLRFQMNSDVFYGRPLSKQLGLILALLRCSILRKQGKSLFKSGVHPLMYLVSTYFQLTPSYMLTYLVSTYVQLYLLPDNYLRTDGGDILRFWNVIVIVLVWFKVSD